MEDWYETLASKEYLGLTSNTKVGKIPLKRLGSSKVLFEPSVVHDYANAVIEREQGRWLYSVNTVRGAGDRITLTAKLWLSITPFQFDGTIEELLHNFIVVLNSKSSILNMKMKRAEKVRTKK